MMNHYDNSQIGYQRRHPLSQDAFRQNQWRLSQAQMFENKPCQIGLFTADPEVVFFGLSTERSQGLLSKD